jgi:clan AA aspartic protease
MIAGRVTHDRSAIVTIEVLDRHQQSTRVDPIIDTGFTGDPTLPPELIARLGLSFVGRGEAILGDGAVDVFNVYSATILWDGQQRRIEVDETRTDRLLGMGLMQGYRLTIDVLEGGAVTLERLV